MGVTAFGDTVAPFAGIERDAGLETEQPMSAIDDCERYWQALWRWTVHELAADGADEIRRKTRLRGALS